MAPDGSSLDEVRSLADAEVGLTCTGYQVCVSAAGRIERLAGGVDGTGRSISSRSTFAVYCAGKPLTALAIGALITSGRLDWSTKVSEIVSEYPALGDVSLDQLLTHRAGLYHCSGLGLRVLRPPARHEVMRSVRRAPQPASTGVYSEFGGWYLLSKIFERVSGSSVAEWVDDQIAADLGDPRPTLRPTMHDDLRVNLDCTTSTWFPLLSERIRDVFSTGEPATGCYSSAEGLTRFYALLLAALMTHETCFGVSPHVLASMVRPASTRGFDPTMGRTCSYGRGFMVALSDHDFGSRPSAKSFGHSGMRGMTFAFADPDRGLAMAAHFNGVVDRTSALQIRRPAIVSAIYRALG